jgi:hypothetical protein
MPESTGSGTMSLRIHIDKTLSQDDRDYDQCQLGLMQLQLDQFEAGTITVTNLFVIVLFIELASQGSFLGMWPYCFRVLHPNNRAVVVSFQLVRVLAVLPS